MSCSCHQTSGYCQCLVADSNCVRLEQVDPYGFRFVIDPAEANIVEEAPAGLRALLPRSFSFPAAAAVAREEDEDIALAADQTIILPFDVSAFDTFGGFDMARSVRRIYFSTPGVYAITGQTTWNRLPGDSTGLRLAIFNSTYSTEWTQRYARPSGDIAGFYHNVGAVDNIDSGAFVELRAYTSVAPASINSVGGQLGAALRVVRLGGL